MGKLSCNAFREIDMTLAQVLEALIFAAPKPLSTAELLAAVKAAGESSENEAAQAHSTVGEGRILEGLAELQSELEQSARAFRLMEQATGWGFVTRGEFAPWVRKLYPDAKPARLSGPAMETLAIIAYRQPVTRADIEAVRGVAVDGVMQVLLDRSLVRIAGRADLPGRPLLYSTTGYFLEHFGLKNVQDLPNAAELGRMNLPKAAVSEDKAAKQRERDEVEPELPLDMPAQPDKAEAPLQDSAPVCEEVSEKEEASSGLAGEEQASSPPDFAGEAPPADDFSSHS